MAKQNKRPMMVKIGDTVFDKIQAFYINPELYPLSDTHETIRQRWIKIVNFQLKAYSKVQIANMLEKEYGISHAQAYIDIRNAENIFGKIIETENEAFKQMWIEWTKDLLKRSRQQGDRKTESKALDLLAKYAGLDEKDLEFNPEKLLNKEIYITMSKPMIEALKTMIGKGVADFNSLNVTDIDYQDVKK